MTASIGGLSASVIAAITVGGIGALIALVIIISYLCDMPKRLRKKEANKVLGGKATTMNGTEDIEKGKPAASMTEVDSQITRITKNNNNGAYTMSTRTPSPVCECEHQSPMPRLLNPTYP